MRICFAALVLVVFISCKKENLGDCFKSNGDVVTEERHPPAFHSLIMHSKVDVLVVQGPAHKVEVQAGKNLLSNILTSVENGTLTLDNRNTCNFVRGYTHQVSVVVTTPYIRRAGNHGVGRLTIDRNFVQDTLLLRAESSGDIFVGGSYNEIRTSSHGNGDIYLHAKCNSLFVFSFGTNFTFADSLDVSESAFLHTFSIGDCRINARSLKKLSYNIQGDGNVYYRGAPPVIEDLSSPEANGKAIRVE